MKNMKKVIQALLAAILVMIGLILLPAALDSIRELLEAPALQDNKADPITIPNLPTPRPDVTRVEGIEVINLDSPNPQTKPPTPSPMGSTATPTPDAFIRSWEEGESWDEIEWDLP